MVETINPKVIRKVAQIILKARHTAIYGLGASALVGQDLILKLQRIGLSCSFVSDIHLQWVNANSLTDQDVAIAISYSGETAEIVKAAKIAANRKACVVGLTQNSRNSLCRFTDYDMFVPVSEPVFREGAGLSRIEQLVVTDILFSVIMSLDSDAFREKIKQSARVVSR